ncbi:hypothetical protein PE067_16280 [Paracoccus sp. DMF-8]|uniref:hypothetical protein n=1 Tax=Paracoccus sp. DMF-8 TaxID=3019445 RepID=UPI0023E37B42|nr:hypothetical protein [Paracoccus sp. DMF-8]MDF3607566.1 hypothetical protein [Paracoccus sp. DMF-8]
MIDGLDGQMTYLAGLRTDGGATVAPWGPGDQPLNTSIPATSITDIAPALGGRGGILLAAQSCYLHRTIGADPDQGALVMDAGVGGLNLDKMLIGQLQGDNYYYMLSEVARLAADQDLTVTCPEIIHYIGTSSKSESYAVALGNINLVWDQQQDWCETTWGQILGIIAGQTGGDCNTAPDPYDVTMAQYDAVRDRGGEIATSQRIWTINDNNIHTDIDVSVMIGEVIDWCREERDAGRKWTPWASITKSGATVTVAFDLRPGETLVNRADFYDAHGGAATAPNFGFEADGGIVSAVPDLDGNTVVVTLTSASASWFRFAMQRQDVMAYGVPDGALTYNQSAHRTTLFPSETRASRFYPGETLWRSLPSFHVLFDGDQVQRLDGTPFEVAP